jgi:hypothetical protein
MAKSMILWRTNPNAPWPIDPVEALQLQEMMFAGIDSMLKAGELLEFGYFPNGKSGYAISASESKDQLKGAFSMYPFVEIDVYDIVPYTTGKEIMRGVLKAQAEQMAAMKR